MCVRAQSLSRVWLCVPMDCSLPGSWDFPDKNTGESCHFLRQGIFLIQGSNQSLLHWQTDSLPLSHLGCPAKMTRPQTRQLCSDQLCSQALPTCPQHSQCTEVTCNILLTHLKEGRESVQSYPSYPHKADKVIHRWHSPINRASL